MTKIKFLLVISIFASHFFSAAQIRLIKSKSYEHPVLSVDAHIYSISVLLENGEIMLWHIPINQEDVKCNAIGFSPTGAYIAGASQKGKIKLWRAKDKKGVHETIKGLKVDVKALAFDKNGNIVVGGDDAGYVNLWDTKTGESIYTFSEHKMAISSLAMNKNGMVVSADMGGNIYFWNRSGIIGKNHQPGFNPAIDIQFSDNGQYMVIGYSDGLIELWDAKDLQVLKEFKSVSSQFNPIVFLPNSMYFAYTKYDSIIVYNCKRFQNQASFKAHASQITDLCSIFDNDKKSGYLLSSGMDSTLMAWDINELEKRYDIIIKEYVDRQVQEWQKVMDYETNMTYQKRVNDESRARKVKELTREITNTLAFEKYPLVLTSMSNFDYEHQTYQMELDSIFNITINVPYEESKKLSQQLSHYECLNPGFVLNDQNDFDLAYVEIYASDNDMTYIYDCNEEYQFDPESINIQFAPIKIATQIAQTEELLKIKLQEFTDRSYLEEKITENVQTNVTAKAVVEETDEGERELNFHVEYSYEVIKASIEAQTDDFPLGEYKFSSSNAAKLTLQVFKESIEKELSNYFVAGKKITIKITGSTDATPITGTIKYLGDYGNFNDEPYILNGNLESVTVNQHTGISSNEQLAFLRTVGVRKFMEDYIDVLKNTNNYYQHFAELNDEKGGEYRRIAIELIIHNAFEGMDNLPDRIIYEYCESDVDVDVPVSNSVRSNTYAVVIGNENYSSFQPGLEREVNVRFAIHDAERMAEYLEKTLGVPKKQIKLLKNATASQISQSISWLTKPAEIDEGQASLFFYFSGHGLPDEASRSSYIIPIDVNGSTLDYALSLKDIYAQLAKIPAKRVTVILDACFSGGARNKPLVEKKMVKVVPKEEAIADNMIVISSSSGTESSGYIEENCHGIFSYFFFKKLKETKGDVTYEVLFNDISRNVRKASALQGDIQSPTISNGYNAESKWNNWQF